MKVYDALNTKELEKYREFIIKNSDFGKLYKSFGTYNYREAYNINKIRGKNNTLEAYFK